MTKNSKVMEWVLWARDLCKPEKVVWIDGEGLDELRQAALATGELVELNQELLPGCYLHRSALNDVARSEDKTFVCTVEKDDAGPNNNWADPTAMRARMDGLFDGAMAGRTMYVVPYCMGQVGSPFAKLGVEITDSIYVVLNMCIMTRVSREVSRMLDDAGEFVKCLHSTGDLSEENRLVCHFPQDNSIRSINSGYGGNALLGKKCFALRIASWQARKEGWLAEHMLIIGIENPEGQTRYVCAAFPSACGKTNLAMLIPPEVYRKKGYKIWCVGDDIAWLRIGADGRLWAINPENGFFGVLPGTNKRTNPNALACCGKDTIYTNVVYNEDDGTVWWEGLDDTPPPHNGVNWKGEKWNGMEALDKGAHPNSRFTASAKNCPCISAEFENPEGVPISAIVFGGRRAKVEPLVYQARSFAHGVFVGSTLVSETTAAQTSAVGVARLDSMAMKPFCGYNMGDYFAHWLGMGERLGDNAPPIFNVNWFRTDTDGSFMWPGFGENMRVLEWILARCDGEMPAKESAIGYMPRSGDINAEGLELEPGKLDELLDIDMELWRAEVGIIRDYFRTYGERLPRALWDELDGLERRIAGETPPEISLVDVDESNYRAVCDLKVTEEQSRFVATPAGTLARAYAMRARNARAWAIARGETVVGLMMVKDLDEDPACYALEQFMVDYTHQNKGYGRQALGLALAALAKEGKYGCVELCVKKEAAAAIGMYMDAGFVDTGYADPGEPDSLVLRYAFS